RKFTFELSASPVPLMITCVPVPFLPFFGPVPCVGCKPVTCGLAYWNGRLPVLCMPSVTTNTWAVVPPVAGLLVLASLSGTLAVQMVGLVLQLTATGGPSFGIAPPVKRKIRLVL